MEAATRTNQFQGLHDQNRGLLPVGKIPQTILSARITITSPDDSCAFPLLMLFWVVIASFTLHGADYSDADNLSLFDNTQRVSRFVH